MGEVSTIKRKFSARSKKAPGTYQVSQMKTIHRRIAELAATGMNNKEIAEKVGRSTAMVRYTRDSPVVQQYMGIVESEIAERTVHGYVQREIEELSPFAIRVVEQLMLDRNQDPKLRAALAKDVLDRAGHGAIQKKAVVTGAMTPDIMAEIKARSVKAGIEAGVIAPAQDANIIEEEDD